MYGNNIMKWIRSRRRRLKVEYIVYLIFFPNADFYIGYTSKHIFRRWKSHAANSSKLLVKPLIKKYGIDKTKIIIIKRFSSMQNALMCERHYIAKYKPTLNRSKGGETGAKRQKS